MERVEGRLRYDGRTNYYIDASSGLLIGFDKKDKKGVAGYPEDLYSLGSYLRDNSIPLIENENYREGDEHWTRDELISFGRFLLKIVPAPRESKEKKLNEEILKRARKLAIGPSLHRYVAEFGSTTRFYQELGATGTNLHNQFADWTSEDFIRHIKYVGARTGQRPTAKTLWQYAKKNPWKYPSPYVISRRVGTGKRIGPAIELAGYLDIYNWDDDDYLNWGVKFMAANNGLQPTARLLNYLSQRKLGPSARTVMNNFGLDNYKSQVAARYDEVQAMQEANKQQKLMDIVSRMEDGTLPQEIFNGAELETDKIVRFARYIVADELLSENSETTKRRLAARSYTKNEFVNEIKKCNRAIKAGDIELAAVYLGVFDDLWPIDDYLERLRLPEHVIVGGRRQASQVLA